jgi:hypothetical protein
MRSTTIAAAVTLLFCVLVACLPAQVKDLNAMGDQAMAQRRYEQAVSYYSQSLALYPDQDLIRKRVGSARVLLRQIYVDKIYELVDNARAPIAEYLTAWQMSAALPSLGVEQGRVVSIRMDLANRFGKSEAKLRSTTEGHNYYLHLTRMLSLVQDAVVDRARLEVGGVLQQQHLDETAKADKARLAGLALLHATAAATFAPVDTGLWADAARRRVALLKRLALPVGLKVQGPSAVVGDHLLGGLKRRLPSIFVVAADATLQLQLRAGRPEPTERTVRDQRSAQCQVGTEKLPNPECDSLRSRASVAKDNYDSARRALDAISARCGAEAQASTCASNISSAESRASSAKREYDDLEHKVGTCPRFIDKPIYKMFFYLRQTIYRQVTASASLTLSSGGTVNTSRAVIGSAVAQDTFGDGLGCANIPPDPLQIDSIAALQATAEGRLLDSSLGELLALRRTAAEKQLAGGEDRDQRLDALVRARLVDDGFLLAKDQLARHLISSWSADFGLTDRVLR